MERDQQCRKPEPMPAAVPYYERKDSRIPEKIRISFSDGTTAVYLLETERKDQLIEENIRIIRKWRGSDSDGRETRTRRQRRFHV